MYICAYNWSVNYQWDDEKAQSNYRKHGIEFADAVSALADDYAITIEDDYPDEERFVTIGTDAFRRVIIYNQKMYQ